MRMYPTAGIPLELRLAMMFLSNAKSVMVRTAVVLLHGDGSFSMSTGPAWRVVGLLPQAEQAAIDPREPRLFAFGLDLTQNGSVERGVRRFAAG